jgi:hypothetical protein
LKHGEKWVKPQMLLKQMQIATCIAIYSLNWAFFIDLSVIALMTFALKGSNVSNVSAD